MLRAGQRYSSSCSPRGVGRSPTRSRRRSPRPRLRAPPRTHDRHVGPHRHDHRPRLRAHVHRQRPARRPGPADRAGLRPGHGAVAVGARRVLRPARRRRPAASQHPHVVDADASSTAGRRSRCPPGTTDELAAVARPANRRDHDDGAVDRARRSRHQPPVPRVHRPRPAERRRRPADADAPVVRHRPTVIDTIDGTPATLSTQIDEGMGERRAPQDFLGVQAQGTNITAGLSSQLGVSANIAATVSQADQSTDQTRQPAARLSGHRRRPRTRSRSTSASRARCRRPTRSGPRRRRRAARRRPGSPAAADREQRGVGSALGRSDRHHRQPQPRDRRQRERVLPVVEHRARHQPRHLPGRPVVERLRRAHLVGRRHVDVPVAARPASQPRDDDPPVPLRPADRRRDSTRSPPASRARASRWESALDGTEQTPPPASVGSEGLVRAAHHRRRRARPVAVLPRDRRQALARAARLAGDLAGGGVLGLARDARQRRPLPRQAASPDPTRRTRT